MSRIREFWLTNANGSKYSLNSVDESFLHQPQGLGFNVSLTTVRLEFNDLIVSEDYQLPPIEGELLFQGKRDEVYQKYFEFIRFLSMKPINLHYLPPNAVESYRCLVRVTALEKTEVNARDKMLHCPIQMFRQTMWYGDEPNILDANNQTSEGKLYPLDRPYAYGAISAKNMRLYNDGMADAPLKIEIFGRVTDVSYSLYDFEGIKYGATKIIGTYDYVMVNSDILGELIVLERDGSNIPNSVNYQDLTVGDPRNVYVTFLKLKPGESMLVFNFDDNFDGMVRATWRSAYVTV